MADPIPVKYEKVETMFCQKKTKKSDEKDEAKEKKAATVVRL